MTARSKITKKKEETLTMDEEEMKGWADFKEKQTKILNNYGKEFPKYKRAINDSIKVQRGNLANPGDTSFYKPNILHEVMYDRKGIERYMKHYFWTPGAKSARPNYSLGINGIWGCYHQSWQQVRLRSYFGFI